MRRLSQRRLDPLTGLCHDLQDYKSIPDTVAKRLVTRTEDSEACVKQQYSHWSANLAHLEECYRSTALPVAGDRRAESVFDEIDSAIQNSSN